MKQSLLLLLQLLFTQHLPSDKLKAIPGFESQSQFKEAYYQQPSPAATFNDVVTAESFDLHCMNAALHEATNRLRVSKKRKPLRFNESLRDAATYHSFKMVTQKFFSHSNPREPALKTPFKRMKYFGFVGSGYAENCDLNYIAVSENETYAQVAERIVKDLYNSKGHRENMLNKQLTQLGCGTFIEDKMKDGVLVIKATQCFGAK